MKPVFAPWLLGVSQHLVQCKPPAAVAAPCSTLSTISMITLRSQLHKMIPLPRYFLTAIITTSTPPPSASTSVTKSAKANLSRFNSSTRPPTAASSSRRKPSLTLPTCGNTPPMPSGATPPSASPTRPATPPMTLLTPKARRQPLLLRIENPTSTCPDTSISTAARSLSPRTAPAACPIASRPSRHD